LKILDEWFNDIPQQFLSKHNIEVLLSAFAKQLDDIQAVFDCLNNQVDLGTAVGVNLDRVGTIIPLTRKEATSLAVTNFDFKGPSLSDDIYRKYLRYENLRDTNECTYYDLMEGIALLWDIDGVQYSEDPEHPATIILDMPINSKTIKIGDVPMIKPAGVGIIWNYKIFTEDDIYTSVIPVTDRFEIVNPEYEDITAGNLVSVMYAGYLSEVRGEAIDCEIITPVPGGGDSFVSGLPYDSGLVAWYDFTDYDGEDVVENKVIPKAYNDFRVVGGSAGDAELLLQGTSSSYAVTDLMLKKDSFTLYVIVKADTVKIGSWNVNTLFGLSNSVNTGNMLSASTGDGVVGIATYGSGITGEAFIVDYLVITLSASAYGLTLYINGTRCDSTADKNISYNIGRYISLGANVLDNGTLRDYNNNPLRFKMIGIVRECHNDEEIAENYEWLHKTYVASTEIVEDTGRYYLIRKGKTLVPFYMLAGYGTGTFNDGINYVRMHTDSGSYYHTVINTQNKIDFTGYSKLVFEVLPVKVTSYPGVIGYSGSVTSEPISSKGYTPFWQDMLNNNTYVKQTSGTYMYEFDISEINAAYYVGVVNDNGNDSCVKSIWLE
jgi:hypothetical protein